MVVRQRDIARQKIKENKGKKPTGNPMVKIDWNAVDEMLVYGANGQQISAVIGIHHDTLYERCMIDQGTSWSEYARAKRSKGDAMLHQAQFEVATKKKNVSMLIHLGKHRLEQKDEALKVVVTPETEASYQATMEQLRLVQREARQEASNE